MGLYVCAVNRQPAYRQNKLTSSVCAAERKGSISAEHGLGVMKAPHIGYSQSDEAISLMRTLKKAIDPKNIMVCCCSRRHVPRFSKLIQRHLQNPYKYFLDEKYAPQETGVHTAEPGH